MPEPLFSVVVPTHGRTDLFLETLQSLERQTIDRFEVIVTDDSASQEDRAAIADAVRRYATTTGRNAEYLFSRPSLGQAANTNQGLAKARGALVRILHSDDLLAPRALEAEVALMTDEALNLGLLFHEVEPFQGTPRFDRQPALSLVQPSLLFQSAMHSSTPLPSATVFRQEALRAIGGMREDFDFLCDWEFFHRLLVLEHTRHRFIGRASIGYVGWRQHPDSTTGRLWHRHFLEHEQFMRELQAHEDLGAALIGDESARRRFFAQAVRYRYRRLASDVLGMSPSQFGRAIPRIARCAFSGPSLRACAAALLPRRRSATMPTPETRSRRTSATGDPRGRIGFALSAFVTRVLVTRARRLLADPRERAARHQSPMGPGLVEPPRCVSIEQDLSGREPGPGEVRICTEFNNTIQLWSLRQLLRTAPAITLTRLNTNAFVEPVLYHCLKHSGTGARVTVRITDNQHLTAFGFKALLDRVFPGEFTSTAQTTPGPGHHVLTYQRTRAGHATTTAPHTGWTFGLLTTGKRLEYVNRFIASIEAYCDEPHEIIVVSPVPLGSLAQRPNVRVVLFADRDELGWITRKKNLIGEQARYSDILVCHDRFELAPDFVPSFRSWGYSYGIAAARVRMPDGRRALDWAVVSSENHVWSAGGLLDYRATSRYVYVPGGATIIRRAFWRDFRWNENLFWNEHEDVELCRRIQRAGGIVSLAAGSLIALEDRWVAANPPIPYCADHEVLYGHPVGEQRIRFLPASAA